VVSVKFAVKKCITWSFSGASGLLELTDRVSGTCCETTDGYTDELGRRRGIVESKMSEVATSDWKRHCWLAGIGRYIYVILINCKFIFGLL
jgi:hypothetical protein